MKNFKKLLMAASVASVCQSSIAADAYQLVDLTTVFTGFNPASVRDINNNGTIVGHLTGPAVDLLDSDGNPVLDTNDNVVQYIDYIRGFSTDGANLIEFQSFEDTDQTTEQSTAVSINESGISVGVSNEEYDVEIEIQNDDGTTSTEIQQRDKKRAVYFDATGVMTAIPELDTAQNRDSFATAINNNGLIVGYAIYERSNAVREESEPTTSRVGILFDTNSLETTVVEPLSNRIIANMELNDVNNNGIAVGWSQDFLEENLTTWAVYFDVTNSTVKTTIQPFNELQSLATAINDDGIVVGSAADPSEKFLTSFAYDTVSEEAVDIGTLRPEILDTALGNRMNQLSQALDVNELANGGYQVVGTSLVNFATVYTGSNLQSAQFVGVYNAYLYEDSTLKNLNDLIDCKQDGSEPVGDKDWVLTDAVAINNQGVIIGHGINNGEVKPYMLVPKAAGETPIACTEPDDGDDDSGSGGIGLFGLLLTPLIFLRRRIVK